LQKIQNQKKRVRKMNQRLAKHVSQWVQTALVHDDTTNSVRIESSTSQSKDDHPTTGPPNQPFYQQPCNNSDTTALSSNNKINLIYSWISLCAIALLAWLAQKTIYDTSK
jgi:Flp pilus assembly protein TadB